VRARGSVGGTAKVRGGGGVGGGGPRACDTTVHARLCHRCRSRREHRPAPARERKSIGRGTPRASGLPGATGRGAHTPL